jgi:NADPH:quinone reductase-like Zn-dependent oxidoreductase
MRRELICAGPATPPRLQVRTRESPRPRAGQVLVRVHATSVNPIDVRRASGYGRRLLGLKGAASFPLVLGNDVAGVVAAVGASVSRFAAGQRVFGVVPTGKQGGAHASHVLVPQEQLSPAPDAVEFAVLGTLPYSFVTMWLAVRSTGLDPTNARGKRVLINGASGGLGRLCLQLLREWGSDTTAVCGPGRSGECLSAGAVHAVERGATAIGSLPANFHVVLNFGSWDDDAALASRLGPDALGHATTVHPLLALFDRFGWWRGALACRRQRGAMQSAVRSRAPAAHYAWTLFKPDRQALDVLEAGVCQGKFSLPVGIRVSLEEASAAFAHVAAGKPGRALLAP